MDTKGNLYVTYADGSIESTTEAWKRLEAAGKINQEKLTILNRDGTTTEVEPVKMWTPPTDASDGIQVTSVWTDDRGQEPGELSIQATPRMNRHELRKAAALARKVKK
ncbi:MAG: hypothetical protein GYA52_04090 [Chloroflexi bacterium]|nr:hypothetical protein [Chloroflexota bacterium]